MRIGVAAEAFGFGPASKAFAISQALQSRGAEVVPLVESVAWEIFVANGYHELQPTAAADYIADEQLDAAVVCLDPAWATILCKSTKTYFVDSLSYMWESKFFGQPFIRDLRGYIVQDVFDSVERVRAHVTTIGVRQVGAIVDVNAATRARQSGADGRSFGKVTLRMI